jgi:hypothetical protein
MTHDGLEGRAKLPRLTLQRFSPEFRLPEPALFAPQPSSRSDRTGLMWAPRGVGIQAVGNAHRPSPATVRTLLGLQHEPPCPVALPSRLSSSAIACRVDPLAPDGRARRLPPARSSGVRCGRRARALTARVLQLPARDFGDDLDERPASPSIQGVEAGSGAGCSESPTTLPLLSDGRAGEPSALH